MTKGVELESVHYSSLNFLAFAQPNRQGIIRLEI